MTFKRNELTVENRQNLHRELIEYQIIHSCLNCDHFQKTEERVCDLYQLEPPPEVIVFSCPSWVPEIPF